MAGKQGARRGIAREVLEAVHQARRPLTAREVADLTGRPIGNVRTWLNAHWIDGNLAITGHGGQRDPYRYYDPDLA
jgi:hypothetical protein